MNQWLAQHYGTPSAQETAPSDVLSKLAHADTFVKVAAKHNIDLSAMSDEQIMHLYGQVFPKTAEEEPKKEEKKEEAKKEEAKKDGEEEKKEAAAAYFLEKRAFQEKFAEADFMGRVMAHAFTQERDLIEQSKLASKKTAAAEEKKELPPFMQKKDKDGDHDAKEDAKEKEEAKEEKKEGSALRVGVGTTKTAAAQAFDEVSATHAVKVAEAAGYDVKVAEQRVAAVYTLGLEESDKIASVQDPDTAVHVRALEYLEAAGYNVNWKEIFGQ